MGLFDSVRSFAMEKGFYNAKDDSDYDDDYDEMDEYDDDDDYNVRSEKYERAPVKDSAVRELPRARTTSRVTSEKSQVVNIHTNIQMQVVISYPETIEEASYICDYLKSHKTVVVNLENVQHDTAQRIIDFLGGVSYAINGDIQYVSNKIFIIAPENVDISGQFKEELKANGIFSTFKTVFK